MKNERHLLLYWIHHPDGRVSGRLLAHGFFEASESLNAWGATVDEVKEALARRLDEIEPFDRELLFWDERPTVEKARVDVNLVTRLDKRVLIGERTAPLRLVYGLAQRGRSTFLIVPRLEFFFLVESPKLGRHLVRQLLAVFLAGADGRSLLRTLPLGEESIECWFQPGPGATRDDFDEAPRHLSEVAEDLVAGRKEKRRILLDLHDLEGHRGLLDRPQPASLLLVGRPGVGKTTWVQRLAAWLARRPLAKGEQRQRLWSSSADRLLAGMSYIGQWEERCLGLIAELRGEGHYLFLDHLLPLVESRGHSSLFDLFERALADQEISLIVEATPEELELCRRRAPGVIRFFRVIHLEEPRATEMPTWVRLYLERLGAPNLRPSAIATLCHLLEAFERREVFPGKAFKFLDLWRQELEDGRLGQDSEGLAALRQPRVGREVIARFCALTGLAADLIAPKRPTSLAELEKGLAQGVIGQEAACAAVARVVARFRAGLYDPEKPLGVLLFVGPTGVGKTEMAKQLARTFFGDEKRLLRVDMSEYQLPGSARRLLAAGRGVQSFAQSLRQQPLAVVLLDEIEKAHREVFDLLLGALGEGRLTDERGGLVDLRMAIVILTSNLGARKNASLGFDGKPTASEAELRQAVHEFFRPELINRLDEIVPFRPLEPAEIEKVVDLHFALFRARPGFKKRKIKLILEPSGRSWLAKHGFDSRYGVRPLLRLIEDQVAAPLAALLAEDPKLAGVTIYIVDHATLAVPAGSRLLELESGELR